jgi:hypothetical protein
MRVSWITEADDDKACKRKLHNAMRRWHPDKFFALFGGALQGERACAFGVHQTDN